MPRIDPAALGRLPAALILAAACLLLVRCHPGTAPAESTFVTVKLHDSLSRFERVEVLILLAGDTSIQLGKVHDGRLTAPGSIPAYRLPDAESRPLAIRVRGYDSSGRLAHDQLISKVEGRQVVANLLPMPGPDTAPKPAPAPSPRLKSLAVSPGSLNPAFSPAIGAFEVDLAPEQSAVVVTAVPETDSAVILLEGLRIQPGLPSDPIVLRMGVNELVVRVTAGDSTVLYSIKVDRGPRVKDTD